MAEKKISTMTKKRNNQIKMGDALKELMDTYKLNVKMNEVRLYESWGKVWVQQLKNIRSLSN